MSFEVPPPDVERIPAELKALDRWVAWKASRTIRSTLTVEKREKAQPSPSVRARRKPAVPVGPSRAARMLALAHDVERLIEAGGLSGYAEAARALGVTRARMTQVMKLVLLAPQVQQRILAGEARETERTLRSASGNPEWRLPGRPTE